MDAWAAATPTDYPNYPAGSWGPEGTQDLLNQGHRWPLPLDLGTPCAKAMPD